MRGGALRAVHQDILCLGFGVELTAGSMDLGFRVSCPREPCEVVGNHDDDHRGVRRRDSCHLAGKDAWLIN